MQDGLPYGQDMFFVFKFNKNGQITEIHEMVDTDFVIKWSSEVAKRASAKAESKL